MGLRGKRIRQEVGDDAHNLVPGAAQGVERGLGNDDGIVLFLIAPAFVTSISARSKKLVSARPASPSSLQSLPSTVPSAGGWNAISGRVRRKRPGVGDVPAAGIGPSWTSSAARSTSTPIKRSVKSKWV
jgi:hypothetical protein